MKYAICIKFLQNGVNVVYIFSNAWHCIFNNYNGRILAKHYLTPCYIGKFQVAYNGKIWSAMSLPIIPFHQAVLTH